MKKHFFFKEYLYHSEFESKSAASVSTITVDYDDIERGLPIGSVIKHETIKTVVENGRFIMYGEYTTLETSLEQAATTESINLDEVLGEGGILPSVN